MTDAPNPSIDRRAALALLGGTAALALPGVALGAPAESLHRLAIAKGMRFGSAVAWGEPGADRASFANPSYAALLRADCGILVAENAMKWQAIRPSATAFDFTRFDALLRDAERGGFAMRGHNLLWHQNRWLPDWLKAHDFGAQPATGAARMLTDHIDTVCSRYGTRIRSYDVVNEAVAPADGTLYETVLSKALGGPQAVLDLAFRTARAAAPDAELVYNDYMSWEPGDAKHRDGVLRLLEGFRARAVPVDALGLQSHITAPATDSPAAAATRAREWRGFLDAVTAMGYRLLVTEFDVRDDRLPAAIGPRDAAVAAYARQYLDVTLEYRQVRDILVWGLSDRYTWLRGFAPRKDGGGARPCPYDAGFRAKPLRAAIADAFRATRPR